MTSCDRLTCEQSHYSARYVRFVLAHAEAYLAAYEAYDPRTSRNELERLQREYQTLPPRHDCSCRAHHCIECARIQKNTQVMGVVVEIGRTTPVNAPLPMPLMLDLERALSVLGSDAGLMAVTQYLNGNDAQANTRSA